MANKQTHGDRNFLLSQDLKNGGKYYYWCITTSFYSSIQFVEDIIFPTKLNGLDCKNISEARKILRLNGRHETRLKLVYQVLGGIAGTKYQWLENKSRNARYVSYKCTEAEAAKAIQYCNEIRKFCYP